MRQLNTIIYLKIKNITFELTKKKLDLQINDIIEFTTESLFNDLSLLSKDKDLLKSEVTRVARTIFYGHHTINDYIYSQKINKKHAA